MQVVIEPLAPLLLVDDDELLGFPEAPLLLVLEDDVELLVEPLLVDDDVAPPSSSVAGDDPSLLLEHAANVARALEITIIEISWKLFTVSSFDS